MSEHPEGEALQSEFNALVQAIEAGETSVPYGAGSVFMRLAAHDWLGRIGDLRALDRRLSAEGVVVPPMLQLARTKRTREDRLELVAQRRLWAQHVEADAAREPIAPPERRRARDKVRVGILSNDLRHTNLGVFVWPLLEHLDRERFEVIVYATEDAPADPVQTIFKGWATAWRVCPALTPRQMAQRIAADELDVLVELGDPWGWRVCAYRPAPLQVSWLGYPGSSGLTAIDHLVLDPFLAPEDSAMLTEAPLLLPRGALTMTPAYFEDSLEIAPAAPEVRNGFVTFGSMNGAYKYSAECLDAWAQAVAGTPGSRFLVVRPEAGADTFRQNLRRAFAARGVEPDRLIFEAVRGGHLPHYNRIDIALDTFPVPGGMTTCETLWMGVPLVSLVGEMVFERVSYAVLASAGLTELACRSVPEYVALAVELAGDRDRRLQLRSTMRERIRAHILGQPQAFAADFFGALESAVRTSGSSNVEPRFSPPAACHKSQA